MSVDTKSYAFTREESCNLASWLTFGHEDRVQFIRNYIALKDPTEIASLFSNFIGMAQTVVENCEEAAQMIALTEFGANPHDVEKMNMPCLGGAIVGYEMSAGVDQGHLCHGCAYRKGSVANTCLVTQADAVYCHDDKQTFMCHENLDASGEPTQKCRGFLKKEKHHGKR